MIPFFRRIRKQLADDNKPLKYMRYAIGEIVLVVIGILIAIQVNNWNQEKIERNEEEIIFKQFINNLNQDKSTINDVLNLNKNKVIVTSKFYELSKNRSADIEGIDISDISSGIRRPLTFTERNKISIENIKNEDIRNRLIEYAFLEKRYEESISLCNEYVRETIRVFLGKNNMYNLDYIMTKTSYGDVLGGKKSIYKSDAIKENIESFDSILFEVRMHSLSIIRDGENLRDKNEELSNKLKELIK